MQEAGTRRYRRRRRWAQLTRKAVPPTYHQIVDHVLRCGCAPGLIATTDEDSAYRAQFQPGEAVPYQR